MNFWLPIPAGGISYMTLRFESLGWRQRFRRARDEIVEHPSRPSWNGTAPTNQKSTAGDLRITNEHTVETPGISVPDIADATPADPLDEDREAGSHRDRGGAASA